jgi:hypothetical protein
MGKASLFSRDSPAAIVSGAGTVLHETGMNKKRTHSTAAEKHIWSKRILFLIGIFWHIVQPEVFPLLDTRHSLAISDNRDFGNAGSNLKRE